MINLPALRPNWAPIPADKVGLGAGIRIQPFRNPGFRSDPSEKRIWILSLRKKDRIRDRPFGPDAS